MNFDDVYNSMLLKRGGSVNDSDIRNSKDSINRKFKNDPSYKLATLRKKTTNETSNLDTRLVNVDTDTYKKKIYVRPDTDIEAGDYIIYPNKTYLALSVEDNLISPCANGEECNYLLKWVVDNQLYTMQSIATNNTKYTLGTKEISNLLVEGNGMFGCILSDNEISRNIKINQRFLLNGQAWIATQTDRISTTGILSVLLGETDINYEIDDLVNNIAGGLAIVPHTYTYNIPNTFEVTKNISANLVYSIKDELGQEIDYSGVTITSDSPLISIINTNGAISISGVDIGTSSMKLSITLGGELHEFDIAFEVIEEVVEPVISYNYAFSQPITALKQYVTTTLTTSKLINGIVDSSLYINYNFDTNTQTLISQGKIVITRKSNSSISIKNNSITSPTTIYLTVTDSSDNTKILDNQAITLTGM